jgi:hypothetical protein
MGKKCGPLQGMAQGGRAVAVVEAVLHTVASRAERLSGKVGVSSK